MCRKLINNNQGHLVICNVMSGKYWVDCVSRISMKQATKPALVIQSVLFFWVDGGVRDCLLGPRSNKATNQRKSSRASRRPEGRLKEETKTF